MQLQVFVRTTDDWYPSYTLSPSGERVVEVTFTQTGPRPPVDGLWRVCVWGGDDCGMERDFTDETEAWSCFLQVIGSKTVTMKLLREMQFLSA